MGNDRDIAMSIHSAKLTVRMMIMMIVMSNMAWICERMKGSPHDSPYA